MIKENAILRLLLLRHRKGNTELLNESLDMAIEALRQPERKTGKWIPNSPVTMKCDQCGFVIKDWDWHRFNFCPNCGAEMERAES